MHGLGELQITATHTGVHIALISPFVCLCHADHNSQSFVLFFFSFYIKIPVPVILVTEKKKKEEETQNSYLLI